MINDIILKITNKCNWECSYCDNTNNDIVSIDKLKYYINEIQKYNPNIIISLSGGEPGLLSKSYLQQIFDTLNNPCEVATNGMFLKNDYHNIFRTKIKNISYHVIPEIYNLSKINVIKENKIPTEYIIIIHKKNLKYIESFIKINSHINFTIKFYIGNDPSLILSQIDIFNLKSIINLNIDDISKRKIYFFGNISNKTNIKYTQNICKSRIILPRIDLINDRIYRCCAGNTNEIDSIKLIDLTLKMLFKYNLFPCDKNNIVCNNCFHILIIGLNDNTL